MAERRQCVFCGSEPVTREHVWPRWISALLGDRGPFHVREAPGRVDRTARELDLVVKRVCAGCNGGWMARLEEAVKPVLTPMILASPPQQLLAPAGQTRLARWAMKTLLMAALLNSDRGGLEEAEFVQHLARRGLPDRERTFIYLSAYDQNTHAIQSRVSAIAVPDSNNPPFMGSHGRIAIGHVLFEVAHFNSGVSPHLPGGIWWEDNALRIWPATGQPRMWPEKGRAFRPDIFESWRVTDQLPPEVLDRYRL